MAVMLAAARRNEPRRPFAVAPEADPRQRPIGRPRMDWGSAAAAAASGRRRSRSAPSTASSSGASPIAARWLTAVSGGSYAATAWTLARRRRPHRPRGRRRDRLVVRADPRQSDGTSPLPAQRARWPRAIGGRGAGLRAVQRRRARRTGLRAGVAGRLGDRQRRRPADLPSARGAADPSRPSRRAVAARRDRHGRRRSGCWRISALPSYRLASLWRVAAGLVVLGVVLEVMLIVVPLLMVIVGGFLSGGTASARAALVGSTAVAGVIGTIWRMAAKPVTSRLSARLPELGGFLLLAAALIWGGKVATDGATGTGVFRSPWVVGGRHARLPRGVPVAADHRSDDPPDLPQAAPAQLRAGASGRRHAALAVGAEPTALGPAPRRRPRVGGVLRAAAGRHRAGRPPGRELHHLSIRGSAGRGGGPRPTSTWLASRITWAPSAWWRRGWRPAGPPSPRRWDG